MSEDTTLYPEQLSGTLNGHKVTLWPFGWSQSDTYTIVTPDRDEDAPQQIIFACDDINMTCYAEADTPQQRIEIAIQLGFEPNDPEELPSAA